MFERLDGFVKIMQGLWFFKPTSHETLPHQFERHAARQPDHPFVVYQDRSFTYGEANALVNRHAHAYKALGLKKGDVVALLMENRPEFYWHFLAMGKLGIVVSLINTHINGDALAHAIRICNPKRVIVGSECMSQF
jgi:acyl-CoA synthetase (AMP-forming)/AMP-acid ligase II